MPITPAEDPNDSATHPKKLIPAIDVAVATAVYTAMTRPTIPDGTVS